VEYPHPLVESVLAETYGIMVYQEQVMQTAQVLGGYSLGGADCCAAPWARKSRGDGQAPRHLPRGAAKKGISEERPTRSST
jgi:DNA polymerase-3 subunit alpha